MRLYVKDNGDEYDEFKIGAYVSVMFSPLTGILILYEKDTGETILEWPHVKSVELQTSTAGWYMKIKRIAENGNGL